MILESIFLSVFSIGILFLYWFMNGRDAKTNQSIVVEFLPPKDVSVGSADFLLNLEVTNRTIASILIEGAVVGEISFTVKKEDSGFQTIILNTALELVEKEDRKLLYAHLFGDLSEPGASTNLDEELRVRSEYLIPLLTEIYSKRSIEKKWFKKPIDGTISFFRLAGTVLVSFGLISLLLTGFNLLSGAESTDSGVIFEFMMSVLIALISLGVAMIVIAKKMPKMIINGAQVKGHLLGLRLFIEKTETERLRLLQSTENIEIKDQTKLLDFQSKLLPFAIIYGQEKTWFKELGDYMPKVETMGSVSSIARLTLGIGAGIVLAAIFPGSE
jgi:hypothetical protein